MKLKPIWIQLRVDQKLGRVEEVPKEKRRRLELSLSLRRQASHRPIPEKKKKRHTSRCDCPPPLSSVSDPTSYLAQKSSWSMTSLLPKKIAIIEVNREKSGKRGLVVWSGEGVSANS